MKLVKFALILIIAGTFTACFNSDNSQTKSQENKSFGLRDADLLDETKVVSDETKYLTDPAGASTKIKRAFENAPPMISHDVEGMLPITIDNNQCIMCHDPMLAESMGATAIPKSHFTNFREDVNIDKKGQLQRDGKIVENSSDIKTVVKPLDHLSNARFNCSACHAPQSQSEIVPENNFVTEFRSSDLNDKSNLLDVIEEGVK
ncbi:nitrate reductase cytochrome c-type subunit [Aliarcobacter skirrowii]|uniref:Periplasmic nitrate reductase, electron transfer subunit n=1 Tax=Aliarcobacter skirrowii CCUG 10374 TaxID=1032239 RepID=A0AAD0SPS6_9BACT|nr:nitrate reductase cytochrome c-type subunit [Aliarcobacter skirrowii]AXX84180.1 periplasmic nitrate reductase NapAB, small subunit, periplasmic diheme cytochrome c550 protein [Aliarcobacter skirrowii CCUG 10374]KAB0621636.1 nitrate reductase cytochrome c-type subunit; periplasmic nitrate reductase electron transfer subunit [Aliarcobacter skirrowii CCUG 10374]MDD2507807.1 nitrate reductase cytochrome c-type subunit [Aliarcobacter skirrowii]MDD3025979.1 nitrate reductase cytochrome c-type subu